MRSKRSNFNLLLTRLVLVLVIGFVFIQAGREAASGDWFIVPLGLAVPLIVLMYALVKRRTYLPYLLVFTLGLEQFRFLDLGIWGTLSKWGGVVLLGLYLVARRPQSHANSFRFSRVFGLQVAYVLFTIGSIAWAVQPEQAAAFISSYALLIIMTLFVLDFVQDETDLWQFVRALILYGVVISAYTIFDYLSNLGSVNLAYFRPESLTNSSNIAGGISAVTISILLSLLASPPSMYKPNGQLLGGMLAICIVGLAATGSRGAFVALLVTAVLMAVPLFRQRLGRRTILMTLALMVLVVMARPEIFLTLTTRLEEIQTDTGLRPDLWLLAVNFFVSSPIWGIGLRSFQYYPGNPFGLSSHSTYFGTLAEGGLIGFGLLAGMLLLAARILVQVQRGALAIGRKYLALSSSALLAALITILVVHVFGDGRTDKILWLLLALAQAAQAVWERSQMPVEAVKPSSDFQTPVTVRFTGAGR
jgi:O-antigen ligase